MGVKSAVQQPHSNRTESTVGAVAEPRAAVAEPAGAAVAEPAAAGAAVAEPAAVAGGMVLALVAVPGHGLHLYKP